MKKIWTLVFTDLSWFCLYSSHLISVLDQWKTALKTSRPVWPLWETYLSQQTRYVFVLFHFFFQNQFFWALYSYCMSTSMSNISRRLILEWNITENFIRFLKVKKGQSLNNEMFHFDVSVLKTHVRKSQNPIIPFWPTVG